ncbi:DUF4350 domain-containing protein [Halobaculum litoreum]|uniref:DUF4350 domain-containing protein n=1 Tax=Halobaculum litoreum TaxID=3031998 RepID=A0ABD5XPC1_9EURY|nr:DUF4350 domain-containing protein [Halobaculum sp. DT92]
MQANPLRLVGTFLLVVVVVVGAAAAVPLVTSQQTPAPAQLDNPQFQPDNALIDDAPQDGSIEMEADAEPKTIVVDAGHGAAPSAESIDPLVSALVANGHTVEFFDPQADRRATLNDSLREADAFLTIAPTRRYSDAELAGLAAFTDAGGRLVVLSDPASSGGLSGLLGGLLGLPTASSGPTTTHLSSQYEMAFRSGYLYETDSERNYAAVSAAGANGSLGDGVENAVLRDAAPVVVGGNATVALASADGTTRSTTRRDGSYAVAAQQGNVAIVGDSDFLAPDDAYRGDNEVLIGNLADFLVSGEKSPEDAPTTPTRSGPGAPSGAGTPPGGA